MFNCFSFRRTLVAGETTRFEGTKPEADEATIATSARTTVEVCTILINSIVIKIVELCNCRNGLISKSYEHYS